MRRVLLTFLMLISAFFLTACRGDYKSVEDFYSDMLDVRRNAGGDRIYHASVFNGQEIINYRVLTKAQKVRVEKLDPESYSNFNDLYVNNSKESYKYNPYTREAVQVFDKKEMKMHNPMEFLVYWGKNDAGYLNHIYKFGSDTTIGGIPCKVIRNIDPITRKEGFSYCVSPQYGVAIYFRIPNIKLEGVQKSEKITWVTKIEEDNLEDYLFELPMGSRVVK